MLGRTILASALVFLLIGCSDTDGESAAQEDAPEPPAPVTYAIEDAESVGFMKDQQQIYQMVGATDGWDGELAGVTVEIYSFADSVPTAAREALSVEPGNMSGWVGACQVGNLYMIHKGDAACEALRSLEED